MKELTKEEMLNVSGGYSWEDAGRDIGTAAGARAGGAIGGVAGREIGERIGREIDKNQRDRANDTGREKEYREAPDHDSGGLL